MRLLRHDALCMELQPAFMSTASLGNLVGRCQVALSLNIDSAADVHCRADGACNLVHVSDMLHVYEKSVLLELKLHITVTTQASHISIPTHKA